MGQGSGAEGDDSLGTFEGWVRNHADGRDVRTLEYQVYPELAQAEGERVVTDALAHVRRDRRTLRSSFWYASNRRHGSVGQSRRRAPRRGAALDACRYVIDRVKQRLPIWKRETYAEGDSGWVNCQVIAEPAAQ